MIFQGTWIVYSGETFYAIHSALQICIPAIVVEMVNMEVEVILLHLHHRLYEEKGDDNYLFQINVAFHSLLGGWRLGMVFCLTILKWMEVLGKLIMSIKHRKLLRGNLHTM